ncbi:MAG TPA: YceI family protein [Pseudonocardiaceae bacterium]|jgi:polyisoprenoid-binding protein YceI|nr:YceI family protein [Pseudonocardiaceae bacterium]
MVTGGQRHAVGNEHGRLILRTSRAGLAAQAGHDLTIEVTRWSGVIVLAEGLADSTVEITAEAGSLRVLEGRGGVKPLSDRDKREIAGNARKILESDRHPEFRYASNKITPDEHGGGAIDGILTILGRDRPFRLEVTSMGEGRYRATGEMIQTEFGIKPYSGLFGALKLADPIKLEAEIDLSGDTG